MSTVVLYTSIIQGNMEKDISAAIEEVISGIQDAASNKARSSAYYKMLQADSESGAPDHFYFKYLYPAKQAMTAWLTDNVKGIQNRSELSKFIEVFTAYKSYYHPHLASIFRELEGSPFSSDKANFVLSEYFKRLRHLDPQPWVTENYWVPNTGSREEWLSLCEELINLRFGMYEKYVQIRELLKAKSLS